MAGRSTRLTAVEGIELRVLDRLVRQFRDLQLEPLVTLPPFMDVKSQHAVLTRLGFMELVPANQLDASAFVLAARQGHLFNESQEILSRGMTTLARV
jgi:hypothetical protein